MADHVAHVVDNQRHRLVACRNERQALLVGKVAPLGEQRRLDHQAQGAAKLLHEQRPAFRLADHADNFNCRQVKALAEQIHIHQLQHFPTLEAAQDLRPEQVGRLGADNFGRHPCVTERLSDFLGALDVDRERDAEFPLGNLEVMRHYVADYLVGSMHRSPQLDGRQVAGRGDGHFRVIHIRRRRKYAVIRQVSSVNQFAQFRALHHAVKEAVSMCAQPLAVSPCRRGRNAQAKRVREHLGSGAPLVALEDVMRLVLHPKPDLPEPRVLRNVTVDQRIDPADAHPRPGVVH